MRQFVFLGLSPSHTFSCELDSYISRAQGGNEVLLNVLNTWRKSAHSTRNRALFLSVNFLHMISGGVCRLFYVFYPLEIILVYAPCLDDFEGFTQEFLAVFQLNVWMHKDNWNWWCTSCCIRFMYWMCASCIFMFMGDSSFRATFT